VQARERWRLRAYIATQQEGDQESQAKGPAALCRHSHGVRMAERSHPVEALGLVAKLQVLNHAGVDTKVHELLAEGTVRVPIGPHKQQTAENWAKKRRPKSGR
jgi:hypothetical protein